MKKIFMFIIVILLASCSTVHEVCKRTSMKPVVFQKDSVTFYTVNVPFCDTVLLHKIKR